MLRSETNTPAMRAKVLSAAKKALHTGKVDAFFEHGQWWITNTKTFAQYCVVDCQRMPSGEEYFEFEQVTNGDED